MCGALERVVGVEEWDAAKWLVLLWRPSIEPACGEVPSSCEVKRLVVSSRNGTFWFASFEVQGSGMSCRALASRRAEEWCGVIRSVVSWRRELRWCDMNCSDSKKGEHR